jgi:non-ribosomal peptide synthetase component F
VSPLFQVTFSIEPPLPDLGPEWGLSEMDAGTAVSKFDLSIELEDRGEVIGGRAIYGRDLFDRATIEAFVTDYTRLLDHAAANPGARLAELPASTARSGSG